MLNFKQLAFAMVSVFYFAASSIALSLKYSPQHENLFIEVTEDMNAMTKMEIYTHEIRVVKRIIKNNVVGHISNPMWLDSRRLRDVPDDIILSKKELWEHRNEVIMFVQKTDNMIKKEMNRVITENGSIAGSIGVFIFGLIDGIFGRRAWAAWNDDPSKKCLTMTGATLKNGGDLNKAKKEMDQNMAYFNNHIADSAKKVVRAEKCKTEDCDSLLEVGGWFSDATSWVGDECSSGYNAVADGVSEAADAVATVVSKGVEDVEKATNYVVTKTEDGVKYVAKKVYKAVKTVVKAEITVIKDVGQLAEKGLEEGVGFVLGPEAKKDLTSAINKFNQIIEAGWKWLKKQLAAFFTVLGNIVRSFQHNIKILGDELVNLIVTKTEQKLCTLNQPSKRLPVYEATNDFKKGTVGFVLHNAVESITALVHCNCKGTLRNLFSSKKIQNMYAEEATTENFDLLAKTEYNYWMNMNDIMSGACGGVIGAFVAPWSKTLISKYFKAWTKFDKGEVTYDAFKQSLSKTNKRVWKKLTSANIRM